MDDAKWMIYGAYGYTGELVAREAVSRGHRPVLAGRSPQKLKRLADELDLKWIAVDLNDPPRLTQALYGVELVFHAAGPFCFTAEPMLRACLASNASYVDITGEIPVFQKTFSYDRLAREKSIALISGAGFDIIPTNCLAAYVARKVAGATDLEIAVTMIGQPSPGTMKSMLEIIRNGGLIRKDGKLVPFPIGSGSRRLRFPDRERTVMPIPWGDLESAYRSTEIPNIITYMAYPRRTIELIQQRGKTIQKLLSKPAIRHILSRLMGAVAKGPNEKSRRSGRSYAWARASQPDGAEAQAWLEMMEGYQLTAIAGVRAVEKILEQRPIGALSPSQAFGADFILEIPGTRRMDVLGD